MSRKKNQTANGEVATTVVDQATQHVATQNVSTEPATPVLTPPPVLSIEDLKNVIQVIDVANSRGAFKAAEMASVGLLYNKISVFIKSYEQADQKLDGKE